MGLYNPNSSGVVHRPFSEKQYCIFDVLDVGVWYRIDTTCLRPEFYTGAPEGVIRRATKKVGSCYGYEGGRLPRGPSALL